jgi:hypothetical protein
MKNICRLLAITGAATTLLVSAGNVAGQQKGNFDPAQFQQRMLERMREQFDVKDDGEWKLISARIEKVMEVRRGTGGGFGGGGFGGPGGFRGKQGGDNGGDNGGKRGTRGGFGGEPNPDQEALQKAIEDKASTEEIKAKLARLRESRKAAEAKLEKAQADLREVLSVRQEAVAVMFGLLK